MAKDFDLLFLDITTTIKTEAAAAATSIDVTTSTGMAAQDAVTIVLDNASVHKTVITSVTDGDTIVIADAIPASRHADVGAVVKSYNGFMCKVEDQRKYFRVTDAPLLPQTMITESASPENIQPEREIQISQSDWRKGFQDFLLEDAHKYYDSENCDARLKGRVMLSPKKLAALAFPAVTYSPPTLIDGALDDWASATNLTSWVEAGDGVDQETTVRHTASGSSAKKEAGAGGAKAGSIYQDLSWGAPLQGAVIAVTAWGRKTDATGSITVGLHDGISLKTKEITSAINTWETGTAYFVISPTATQCRVTITYTTGLASKNIYIDDVSISFVTPALGATVKEIEFGSAIVVVAGNCLFNSASGAIVTLVKGFAKTITDLCVFQNRLYIAQGWSDEYYYTSDLITFTESTLANSTAKHMSNIGNSQFWISDSLNTLRDSDNPINGGTALSTQYIVGSSDFDITDLVDHESIVFVRKEDDVYYLSVGDVLSLLELDPEATTAYAHKLFLWGDNLYIPSGINSLYEYDISSGVATVISPTRYATGDVTYDEEILAICADETYLYIAQDNGSSLNILAGRWEEVGGESDWYWHPIYEITMNDITAMLVSSLTGSKRLYVGTTAYADGIIPFFVSAGYSAPWLETGYECVAAGTFYTPWFTSNFPTEEKYWKSIDITSICITSKTSITVSYQVKGGSWVAMTALTTSALNGSDYPDEVTDNRAIGVSSERIRFKFAMASAVDEYTPILYGQGGGFVVYSVLQSDRKRQIEATVVVAATTRERGRTALARTVSTDLTNLRALYQGNDKETVVAPDDTEYEVIFAREGYEEQLAYDDVLKLEVWWVSLRLLEV